MISMKKRYLVDLFAGCGGLSLGLENAGFYPLLVNELADEARETYLVNRKGLNFKHFEECPLDNAEEPWVWKDVTNLRKYLEEEFRSFAIKVRKTHGIDINQGELDLVVGGPPCQGYSGIGHRRSYPVDKKHMLSNHMYQHMIAVIDKLRPKMFLFENVRGLLSARWYRDDKNSHKGDIWLSVREDFKQVLGSEYDMGWHLVRASEYGVSQNRPRVFLVGIRKDLGWKIKIETLDADYLLIQNDIHRAGGLLPEPSEKPPSLYELLNDLIDKDYKNGGETYTYPKPAKSQIAKLLRAPKNGGRPLAKGQPVTDHKYSRHKDHVVKKFQYMIDTDGEIMDEDRTKKFAQRLLPREWPNGQPSITVTSLPDDYVHFEQPRTLTVREWARLQMFPDWYQFMGKRTTGGIRRAGNPIANIFEREVPKYTQIGNAVPVRLAEAIGNHFMALLDECDEKIPPNKN